MTDTSRFDPYYVKGRFDWVRWNVDTKGTIRKPRRERQRDYLVLAQEKADSGMGAQHKGIALHIEGGWAFDKDLRELVKKGLLKMTRVERSSYWAFGYTLSTSVLVITDKGREAIRSGT